MVNIIVVGAGLSGLCAADLLVKEGNEVTVLEANNRVGGRLHTLHDSKCGYVDVGGAYLGPTQDRMFRLAKELQVKTYDVPNHPDSIYHFKGTSHRINEVESAVIGTGFIGHLDSNNFYRELDKMCNEVPMKAPWAAKNSTVWDKMTLAEWQKQRLWTESSKNDTDMFSRINFAAGSHEVSLLWALWYVRGAGGVNRINSIKGGAQEKKFIGGSQQIPKKIAEKLGARVHLNEPVTRIDYSADEIEIYTATGKIYKADYVILALAPALQRTIFFEPCLPSQRALLNQRIPMGSVIKTMMYYDREYWTEKGLGGTAYMTDNDPFIAPVDLCMNDTKPDGTYPALIGFVPANKSTQLSHLSTDERKQLIADEYAEVFGIEALKHPTHYVEKNWAEEPWSGGCYVGHMGPGVMTTVGRCIRDPVGPIHFAGTETATEWPGYMEGAVQAGERAAREILHELGQIEADAVYQTEPPTEGVIVPELNFTQSQRWLPSVGGAMVLCFGSMSVAVVAVMMAKLHGRLWK